MEEQEKEAVKFLPFLRSQKQSPKQRSINSYVPSSCSYSWLFPFTRRAARAWGRVHNGTPLMMVGLLVVAAVTALLHHIYLSFLHGQNVQQQLQQFWIKNSSNALSTSIQWLCAASLSLLLTQLVRNLSSSLEYQIYYLHRPGHSSVAGLLQSSNWTTYSGYRILAQLLASHSPVAVNHGKSFLLSLWP